MVQDRLVRPVYDMGQFPEKISSARRHPEDFSTAKALAISPHCARPCHRRLRTGSPVAQAVLINLPAFPDIGCGADLHKLTLQTPRSLLTAQSHALLRTG